MNLKNLEALAKEATPGPWKVAYLDKNGQAVVKSQHTEVATCWHHCVGSLETQMQVNARLIAAANPAAILELIATMKMMGAAVEEIHRHGVEAPHPWAKEITMAPLTAYRKLMGEEK